MLSQGAERIYEGRATRGGSTQVIYEAPVATRRRVDDEVGLCARRDISAAIVQSAAQVSREGRDTRSRGCSGYGGSSSRVD
jgi:hypothetical protein